MILTLSRPFILSIQDISINEVLFCQKSNKKSNPTFPTLSDFFRLLDFFRLSDSTALTQIMKAEGREEFVPGNSRWPGAQEWLVGSIQRGSSSRVRTEQKVELSLSLGPLVLPFLVIHQSSSLVSLILLAPSGALVFIMVYYIPSSAAQRTHFSKFFKFFRFESESESERTQHVLYF